VDSQRIEFSISESSVLVLLPHDLGGLTQEAFVNHLQDKQPGRIDLRRDGYFFDLYTTSDGGYTVRLVQGDLTPEEKSKWVAHTRGRLKLPNGKLIVCGAHPWIDYDWPALYDSNVHPNQPPPPADWVEWVERGYQNIPLAQSLGRYDTPGAYIEVNPGFYCVDVYSYFPDLSAEWGIPGLSPELREEAQEDYFERTHPDEPLPDWMEGLSVKYINFLVHLTHLDRAAFDALVATSPERDHGWELRKPAVTPSALTSEFGAYATPETGEDDTYETNP
jgi:hypothetical protein